MTRLAWFTPLPPDRSGIAAYSAELLKQLARTYAIDAFVGGGTPGAGVVWNGVGAGGRKGPRPRRRIHVFSAHDFPWKHAQRPYDLVVYQLGNAICHDYMWAYLFRYPGLVVLHDGQLHHARGRFLLQRKRYDDYRAEFSYNHPEARPDIAELSIAGLLGSLHYFWPMVRTVVDAARVVTVHSPMLAAELQEQHPGARIERVRMGVARHPPNVDGQPIRERCGISSDATVFAAFGRVTPEKRVSQILLALAGMQDAAPPAHLILVGETTDYYDAAAEARSLGVAERVTLTGFVDEGELAAYTSCADVCLCMRWPSTGETSASWLRCLAAGKPTIVTDLRHSLDTPALVTRGTWTPSSGEQEPICVSIDILDENNSLQVAMHRLARDSRLRARLGEQAHAFWARNHTLKCMAEDYQRIIDIGVRAETPTIVLPPHLRPDGADFAREIARDIGVSIDILGAPRDQGGRNAPGHDASDIEN